MTVKRVQSEPIGFVYLWTNILNGKKYIGSHIGDQHDGYVGSGSIFLKAVKKHSIQNFERTILAECFSDEELRTTEEGFLAQFDAANDDNFYNLRSKVGGGWEYINTHYDSAKIRKKQATTISKTYSDYDRHPKGFKDKNHSPEIKKQISNTLLKLKRGNPVLRYNLNGEYIDRFVSISQAAKAVNGKASNIKYTIEGKHKYAYGYKWKYEN